MKSEIKERATPSGMAFDKNDTNHNVRVQGWKHIGELLPERVARAVVAGEIKRLGTPYYERRDFIEYWMAGWVDVYKRADSWINDVEKIIPTLPVITDTISLRGLYEKMVQTEKQKRATAKRRIRWLGSCHDNVTGSKKFYSPPVKGHVDTKALKKRIDCRDLAESYLAARRHGKTTRALCPFHSERTASFYAYQDGFKCFGCQWSGDALKFVMEMERVNFPTALEKVGGKL